MGRAVGSCTTQDQRVGEGSWASALKATAWACTPRREWPTLQFGASGLWLCATQRREWPTRRLSALRPGAPPGSGTGATVAAAATAARRPSENTATGSRACRRRCRRAAAGAGPAQCCTARSWAAGRSTVGSLRVAAAGREGRAGRFLGEDATQAAQKPAPDPGTRLRARLASAQATWCSHKASPSPTPPCYPTLLPPPPPITTPTQSAITPIHTHRRANPTTKHTRNRLPSQPAGQAWRCLVPLPTTASHRASWRRLHAEPAGPAAPTREQLNGQAAHAPDVRGGAHALHLHHLGRHPVGRAHRVGAAPRAALALRLQLSQLPVVGTDAKLSLLIVIRAPCPLALHLAQPHSGMP